MQSNSNDIEKYYGTERTEEVRDIIERMPTKFGLRISLIVIFIFVLMLVFGWAIRYPDVVKGEVTINTSVSPVKLMANTSGKLHLNGVQSQFGVNEHDILAYVEGAASFDTLQHIKNLLMDYVPDDITATAVLRHLPLRPYLGELTPKYYSFLTSLHELDNFQKDELYEKQIRSLVNLHSHQISEVQNSSERININKGVMEYSHKFLARDSFLYRKKVSTESELDKSRLEYLSSRAAFASARSSQIDAEKQAQQTLSKITEVQVQRSERLSEIRVALLASYNDLMDNIALWEQKYLFVSPFKGKVQFLRFWTNGQFVQADEPVFTIVPEDDKPYGQIILPAMGAGKVKIGQEAIIKLNDFPYSEYGSVSGTVRNVSLTTNTEKTEQGNVEAYLVTVVFPKGLMTNYGKPVAFKHEAKGIAEIITKDRRLIERLFDNLKYILNK